METPMMINLTNTNFSLTSVYKTNGELKFVNLKSEDFLGRFTILIIMDNMLTKMEIDEWKDFSNHADEFKLAGANVLGVCTYCHISMKAIMTNSFSDFNFPIIFDDTNGNFSGSLGVARVKNANIGAASALMILDNKGRLVHLTLHDEHTKSNPVKLIELIKPMKSDVGDSAGFLKHLPLYSLANIDESEDHKKKKESEKKDNVAENDTSEEKKGKNKIVMSFSFLNVNFA